MTDSDGARLACAPNFREVGGQTTRSGCSVQPGRLFRSDAINEPDAADLARLQGCGIAVVFDLRSRTEREAARNVFWQKAGIALRPVDMLAQVEGASDPWEQMRAVADLAGADTAMEALYAGFPASLLGELAAIIDAVLNAPGATLVHCTAGKDRTGFLVALLLSALGVSRDTVFADYMVSLGRTSQAARAATDHLVRTRIGKTVPEPVLDRLMSVRESYLAASFGWIDTQFGGVSGYLSAAGVTAEQIVQLEALLVS